jgi:outer membrane protein assembly factor BamB
MVMGHGETDVTMIIDLDSAGPADAPPPKTSIRRRAVVAGAAVSLLLSLSLGGSAGTASVVRPLTSVPAIINDSFELAGDRLFVLANADGSTRIDAYRLPGGQRLWRATVPEQMNLLQFAAPAGVLLAETDGGPDSGRIAALDAGTGRVLWRQTGALFPPQFVDPHVLMMQIDPDRGQELRLVDPRTGARLWSSPVGQGDDDAATGSGRLVLRSDAGDAQVVDEDTGRVLATGRLAGAPDPGTSPARTPMTGVLSRLFAAGGQLFVTSPQARGTVVTAYAADTFAQRWQITVDDIVRNIEDCGPVLCFNGDGAITAVEPATGRTRWRNSASIDGIATDGWLRATVAVNGSDGQVVVMNPDTGKVALDLGPWAPVTRNGGEAPPVLTRSEFGRLGAWVAVPEQSQIRPVGWLPDVVSHQCQLSRSVQTYLACATHTGPVRVWEYRP